LVKKEREAEKTGFFQPQPLDTMDNGLGESSPPFRIHIYLEVGAFIYKEVIYKNLLTQPSLFDRKRIDSSSTCNSTSI